MSLSVTHFAVGATLTVLVETYLVPNISYPRAIAILGGIWAMVPDAQKLSPVFQSELATLHYSPLANVFWFHRWLDVTDSGDSVAVAAASLFGLFVATVVSERRSYRALERVREFAGEATEESVK
ncbi:hypothetical protein [Halorussus halophilus]|uniref:hypothetical protein n=1 Tax=Halorussus halophilus TaxID=2650975 RepID=UPI001300EA2B|nr:hypothetical protein [Halorussus halophilus]